jgi:CelD/BcsL family acetyltransferase involved in cellulose biosynthesis
MRYLTEVIDKPLGNDALRTAWDILMIKNSQTMQGQDATSGFVWFESLVVSFAQAKNAKVVVVREGDEIVALLPLVAERGRWFGHQLYVPTMLYGGRNGIILAESDNELLIALLGGVKKAFGQWQSIQMLLVDSSHSERLLLQVCEQSAYRLIQSPGFSSPFLPLLDDPESFGKKMAKTLRQRIKVAPVKLGALGVLEFRELSGYSDAQSAMDDILVIERSSWKHEAGTAISVHPEQERFYRALFPRALHSGLLYGQFIYLNGIPIAFDFGLIQGGVFSSLKHSQTTEHERLCPSHLLKAAMIDKLRTLGVTHYDFMGTCEPHKLQWSDATELYGCYPARLYSASLCGRLSYVSQRFKLWGLGLFGLVRKVFSKEIPQLQHHGS